MNSFYFHLRLLILFVLSACEATVTYHKTFPCHGLPLALSLALFITLLASKPFKILFTGTQQRQLGNIFVSSPS